MFRCFNKISTLCVLCLVCGGARPASCFDRTDALSLIVQAIQQCEDDSTRLALMKGTLRGLEGRRNVGSPMGWGRLSREIRSGGNEALQETANQLSQIFGDEKSSRLAIRTVKDINASTQKRRQALRALVSQRYPGLVDVLPSLLELDDLRLDAIRAFGVLYHDHAADVMVAQYTKSNEQERRAIIETLATRKEYALALVDFISPNVIPRDHIPSYTARSLRDLLGKKFTDVYGEISELKTDTVALIAKYKSKLTPDAIAKANAGRGRAVFQKTCGACHLMYGTGGKIGPDLTGSNRANLDYLLLNSIDPSGDVPEGYRTMIVQTVDGRVLTGVLSEEDSQRVVLKTVDQPRLVIAKADIEARKVSQKSMMPEGQLDQLSATQLLDLVKYMQTKTQVEAVQ